jgi:acetyltransferase
MDKHYLTPLFTPESIVVFAGPMDAPENHNTQAIALIDALRAQRYAGTSAVFGYPHQWHAG